MWADRVDELLSSVGAARRLAEHVDGVLDAHPLPVDEQDVQAIKARLVARISRDQTTGHRRVPIVVGLVVLAAAMLFLARSIVPTTLSETASEPLGKPALQLQVPVEGPPSVELVEQHIEVLGQQVTSGQWIVRGEGPDGRVVLTFTDGEPPPVLDPTVFDTPAIHQQLERARFDVLPERTLQRLDSLELP